MGISAWQITDGEIAFTNNTFTEITGRDALAQRLEGKLSMFAGEWFLDLTEGLDWPDILGTKPFRAEDIETDVREVLLDDPAVTGITSLVTTFDAAVRGLSIIFEVSSDVGLVHGGVARS